MTEYIIEGLQKIKAVWGREGGEFYHNFQKLNKFAIKTSILCSFFFEHPNSPYYAQQPLNIILIEHFFRLHHGVAISDNRSCNGCSTMPNPLHWLIDFYRISCNWFGGWLRCALCVFSLKFSSQKSLISLLTDWNCNLKVIWIIAKACVSCSVVCVCAGNSVRMQMCVVFVCACVCTWFFLGVKTCRILQSFSNHFSLRHTSAKSSKM